MLLKFFQNTRTIIFPFFCRDLLLHYKENSTVASLSQPDFRSQHLSSSMAAESILSAFLPVILEKLISPAIQQLSVAFGTNDKLKKLKRILESIQPVLVDAEERQTADISIKNWLSILKDAAYEAEDVLEDFDFEAERKQRSLIQENNMGRKVRPYCSFYKSAMTCFGLRRRLNDIIRKIEAIADETHRFNFHLSKVPRISYYGRPQTHSYVDKETVIGREKDKEDIVSCLISHAVSNNKKIMVLPIVAMGGMGKTTLSQLIYRDHRVETHFQLCMWVCVSDADFDAARLVRLIIEAATKQECKILNMELLQDQLREIISRKRYLIVLDDVWNENPNEWNRLKILLDCGGLGSSILVTTRSMIAAKMMATHNIIHDLKQLAEEDSWELFRRKAFAEGVEEPVSLVKIGKDIIKRCGGLPLAIDTLGSMMRLKNDEEEWKAVLNSEIWKMRAAKDNILPALRLSYNYLPSHLKQCFTFCAMYPKDYEMEKDTLIQLWMANGYIPTDEKGDLEIMGRDIFDELVWRSFFQNVVDGYGAKVTCKMHDLMHDLAQSVMGKECLTLPNIKKWEDIPSTTKHLLIEYFPESSIPGLQNPRTIRTIILPRGLRSKDALMLKSLRVLRLSLNNSRHFNKQASIRHLRHLRWLDMSDTLIKEFPEDLCSLYNLQTLKLSGCYNLKKLPDNLTDLVNLRHLYTDGCSSLACMPRKMVRLKQLRTLTMYIVSDEVERGIEQLHDLNLYGKLQLCGIEKVSNAIYAEEANLLSKQNLRSITLSWGNADSLEVFTALKPHNGLTMLEVLGYGGQQFPRWMDVPQQLQNLVEMKLKFCTKCKELPLLGQLPSLKFLELVDMDDIKHIISKTSWHGRDLQETLFPSLNKLQIIDMKNLNEWWEEEGSNVQARLHRSFLPHLKKLVIKNCEKLSIIPSLSQMQDLCLSDCQSLVHLPPCLPSVCNLIIDQCNSLESLPEPGNNLPELQILKLHQCDGLASLPQRMESVNILDISKCNQLTSLPEGLTNLHTLILEQCYGLVYLPNDMEGLTDLKIIKCNGLTSLPKGLTKLHTLVLVRCDGLVSLSEAMEEGLTQLQSLSISECNRLTSLPMGLTKLNTLVLAACDGLASLPEGMEGLTQLQRLTISDCNRLRSLPEGLQQRLPNLTSLIIGGHDELTRRFQLGGDYWHLIVNISSRNILKPRV